MNLVIVESPAKAKTINKYLGRDFRVLASYGHVRDLPSKDGSVDPDDDFAMRWEVDSRSQKRLADIVKAVKESDELILATDPDREGEAISWHVLQVLKAKKALNGKPVRRVVFNAITREAVLDAMANPRDIDDALVDAYLARRALDYLVGFTLSPVLWRKLPGARSAGRVQSVALRLVSERELEIETFIPQEYWSLAVTLETPANGSFIARVNGYEGQRLARLDIRDETTARTIEAVLQAGDYRVAAIDSKPVKRNPAPPFTTSTLQQEASRKLGFSASHTMRIAQRLYEGIELDGETVGLITYMRTDGVQMAPEAVDAIRTEIGLRFGDSYVPDQPRHYKTKAKNAQEAHEAIRPTSISRRPDSVAGILDSDQARLYDLIWKRAISSQMASAEMERTTADIECGTVRLRATGQVVRFDGFLTIYQEGRDDESTPAKSDTGTGGRDDDRRLPPMQAGEKLTKQKIDTGQHFTDPPPRYTEATLIKKMEELGIGRPSTYTSTLSVLRDRDYVRLEKRALVPEDKGRLVTAFLQSFFSRYVEYDFTAALEEQLDKISAGELSWKQVLRDFWRQFSAAVEDTRDLRVSEVLDALNELLGPHIFPPREDGADPRLCPSCSEGRLSLKVGKYGAFIGCSNHPECKFTRQIRAPGENGGDDAAIANGGKVLGQDPETGQEVSLRTGRFGPYVQLGDNPEKGGDKPKRSSVPKGWSVSELTLEQALALLSLPRAVGKHPESGETISAGIGRYGPFVQHERTYANLDSVEEVFSVGLNRAVTLIAEKVANGGRQRPAATVIKELGDHPDGGVVTVRKGRYGPYVNHGRVNATLSKETDPASVTMETALELIAAKAGKKKPAKRASAKRTTAKRASAKKASSAKTKRGKAKPKASAGAQSDPAEAS